MPAERWPGGAAVWWGGPSANPTRRRQPAASTSKGLPSSLRRKVGPVACLRVDRAPAILSYKHSGLDCCSESPCLHPLVMCVLPHCSAGQPGAAPLRPGWLGALQRFWYYYKEVR